MTSISLRPESEAGQVAFDLSQYSEEDRVGKRFFFWTTVGWSLVCGPASGYFLLNPVLGLLHHQPGWRSSTLVGSVIFGLLLLFACVRSVVILPQVQPGGIRIDVESNGPTIHYPDARVEAFRWDDPKVQLCLVDYSSGPLGVRVRWCHRIERNRGGFIFGPYYRRTILSEDAFEAVLAAARSHRVSIQTRVESAFRWDAVSPPVVHRVGGAKQVPA